MWVVIVNVFSSSPTSDELREAKEFEEIVDSTMNDGTRDVRVDVRGVDDIANLLFAPRWGYDDEKAMIAFDHIDIFFIRGSIAILPWFKSMRPVRVSVSTCFSMAFSPLLLLSSPVCPRIHDPYSDFLFLQLLLLMQQCLVCHTPTFTSGFGTLLSTYALATDSLVTNIVNGYALGSPLKDITLIPPPERSPYDHGPSPALLCSENLVNHR